MMFVEKNSELFNVRKYIYAESLLITYSNKENYTSIQ